MADRHPVLDWLVKNGRITEEELATARVTICTTGDDDE